jgi:hypothetical protein
MTTTAQATIRRITLQDVTPGMALGRFAQWVPGGPCPENLSGKGFVDSMTMEPAYVGTRYAGQRVCVLFTDGRRLSGEGDMDVWEVAQA